MKRYSVYVFCVGTFLIQAKNKAQAITALRNWKDLDPTTLSSVPDKDFKVTEIPNVSIFQIA